MKRSMGIIGFMVLLGGLQTSDSFGQQAPAGTTGAPVRQRCTDVQDAQAPRDPSGAVPVATTPAPVAPAAPADTTTPVITPAPEAPAPPAAETVPVRASH